MNNNSIIDILKLVWPIIVLQLGMQIYALAHLIKAKRTKTMTPVIWAVIIIVGEILGPVLYFILGKTDDDGSTQS